jgi:hypothetical protein
VLSPWSIEQGKRQKEGAKDFTVHPDVRRTPEKGLRAVSRPTAADTHSGALGSFGRLGPFGRLGSFERLGIGRIPPQSHG